MKKIVGKTEVKEISFPRNLKIGDTKITEKSLKAKNLNDFLVNFRPETCVRFSNSTKALLGFLPEINTILNGTVIISKCVSVFKECTAQKMKFSIKDFFSKCDQIPSFLRIWSHLL